MLFFAAITRTRILKYDKDTNTLTADEVFQAGNTTTIKGNGTSKARAETEQ